ncbi:MAG: response regulator [bacterium]
MAHVLVVEDVKFISRMLAEILRKAGHDVEVAVDGREAIGKIAARRPDLVLLDVSMPEVDGLEVAATLKQDPGTSALPVIMVTARTDEATRTEAKKLGVAGFVRKPFETATLLREVSDALDQAPPPPEESIGPSPSVSAASNVVSAPAQPVPRAAEEPAPSPGSHRLIPGVDIVEHPKALVVRLEIDRIADELFVSLEPELAKSARGVLVDWRAPSVVGEHEVRSFAELAAKLATENRALRVANAPEQVVRAFEAGGQAALLLRTGRAG